ncbi:hypothetical protein GN244_ATG13997 [Phytophthora infestans]|uniref:Uncharacterized protein n=1 Tax=Phytophthora infestans TaxID=4787 RepID=A0A833W8T5_PHYIN|nr:hypothetical protein GN244_ATG13997 [Phytophthora infestans]
MSMEINEAAAKEDDTVLRELGSHDKEEPHASNAVLWLDKYVQATKRHGIYYNKRRANQP